MANTLQGKVVLITGASSGFGEEAARLFAKEGCKVVLTARRLERLQQLAAEIQSQGGEAIAIPVDVNQKAEIDVMVQTALDLYQRIDILFNNAGFGAMDWFEELEPERHIETLIRVNLIGTMLVTRAVLPGMLDRGSGHIINMVSVAGLIASPLITTYSASKYGVRAFTDALRREVAPLGLKSRASIRVPPKRSSGHICGRIECARRLTAHRLAHDIQICCAPCCRRCEISTSQSRHPRVVQGDHSLRYPVSRCC